MGGRGLETMAEHRTRSGGDLRRGSIKPQKANGFPLFLRHGTCPRYKTASRDSAMQKQMPHSHGHFVGDRKRNYEMVYGVRVYENPYIIFEIFQEVIANYAFALSVSSSNSCLHTHSRDVPDLDYH